MNEEDFRSFFFFLSFFLLLSRLSSAAKTDRRPSFVPCASRKERARARVFSLHAFVGLFSFFFFAFFGARERERERPCAPSPPLPFPLHTEFAFSRLLSLMCK